MQSRRHSTKGGQKYIVLMDALLEMESYDVEELKKRCAGEKFLKQLPAARRYLMDQLLKSLRDFHTGDSAERHLKNLLDDVELLYARGLTKNCRRQLNLAIELARKYDLPIQLLDCLRWERRLLKRELPRDLKTKMVEVEKEEGDALWKVQREQSFLSFHDRELLKFDTREDMPSINDRDSFYGQLAYLMGMGIAAKNRVDSQEAFSFFQKTYELYRAHPHQIETYTLRFRSLLENYLGACLHMGDVKAFRKAMKEMRELPGLSQNAHDKIKPVFAYLEMLHLLNLKQMEEARRLAEDLEQMLSQGKDWGAGAVIYRYNLAIAFLLFRDPRSSLRIFQSLQVKDIRRMRIRFYTLARIWEVLLHMMLDNGGVLPYLGRSLRRYLEKEGTWEEFGKTMVEAAQRWSKAKKSEKTGHVEVIGLALEEMGDFQGKEDMRQWVRQMLEVLVEG